MDRAATSVIWLSNEVDFSVPVHPLLSGEFEFIEAYRLSGKCVKSDAACVAAIRIVDVLLGGVPFRKGSLGSGRPLPLSSDLRVVDSDLPPPRPIVQGLRQRVSLGRKALDAARC